TERDDVPAGHAGHVAVNDRLEPFAQRDRARDGRVDASRRRHRQAPQRGGEGAMVRRLSALTSTAGDTRVNADDPDSPARTASLTTRPSDESTFVVRKSGARNW